MYKIPSCCQIYFSLSPLIVLWQGKEDTAKLLHDAGGSPVSLRSLCGCCNREGSLLLLSRDRSWGFPQGLHQNYSDWKGEGCLNALSMLAPLTPWVAASLWQVNKSPDSPTGLPDITPVQTSLLPGKGRRSGFPYDVSDTKDLKGTDSSPPTHGSPDFSENVEFPLSFFWCHCSWGGGVVAVFSLWCSDTVERLLSKSSCLGRLPLPFVRQNMLFSPFCCFQLCQPALLGCWPLQHPIWNTQINKKPKILLPC